MTVSREIRDDRASWPTRGEPRHGAPARRTQALSAIEPTTLVNGEHIDVVAFIAEDADQGLTKMAGTTGGDNSRDHIRSRQSATRHILRCTQRNRLSVSVNDRHLQTDHKAVDP